MRDIWGLHGSIEKHSQQNSSFKTHENISRTQIKVGSQYYCEAWEKIEQGWQDHYHIIQDVFVRHYFIGLIKK